MEIISYGRNPMRKMVSGKEADGRFHPPTILSGPQTVQTTFPWSRFSRHIFSQSPDAPIPFPPHRKEWHWSQLKDRLIGLPASFFSCLFRLSVAHCICYAYSLWYIINRIPKRYNSEFSRSFFTHTILKNILYTNQKKKPLFPGKSDFQNHPKITDKMVKAMMDNMV